MLQTSVAFVLLYTSWDSVPEEKTLAAKLFFDVLHMWDGSRNAEGCKGDDQGDR